MSILIIVILVFWLASIVGLVIIIYKKWPQLKVVEERVGAKKTTTGFWLFKRESISFRNLFPDNLLHKIILRLHILALKSSNKTHGWLERIRAKSQLTKGAQKEVDNYWKELKKSAKK